MIMKKKIKAEVVKLLSQAAEQAVNAGRPDWNEQFSQSGTPPTPVPFTLAEKIEVMTAIDNLISLMQATYADEEVDAKS
jgi:hypothetical protein